jgi:branched-chain amino acid transport system substrate-binding protein
VIAVFTNMWNQLDTNKQVGGLFPNDGDGNAWGDPNVGFPPVLAELGFNLTDPGRYQNLTDDFSAQINAFAAAMRNRHRRRPIPPDFTTFWTQAKQQGFTPQGRVHRQGDPVPAGRRGAGPTAAQPVVRGLVVERHPFTSSITGASAGEVCEGFTGDGPAVDAAHRLRPRALRVAVDVMGGSSDIRDRTPWPRPSPRRPRHHRRPDRWDGAGLPPFARRTSPRRRLSAGSGGCRMTAATTWPSWTIQTIPTSPTGGTMEEIG